MVWRILKKILRIALKTIEEYDDDIIEVALNGKVVFKGYAEEWCDDNFYDNFRWTGSQYEANNSQGKWIVKVVS